MTLYLAGPITAFEGHRQAFADAKDRVRELGHNPISPLDIYPGENWRLAMQADIPVLLRCEGIVMLQGWPQSKGAKMELGLAAELGLKVFLLVGNELINVSELPRS